MSLIIFFFVVIGASSAATVNVNPTPNAIHNAIKAAHAGDTLNLATGTYKEHDIVVDKSLTFTGPVPAGNNPPSTVIDAQNMGRGFKIQQGVTVTLKYMIIQNGNSKQDPAHDGGGIFNDGNLNLKNCIITKNTAGTDSSGGGIYNGVGTLTLTNSNVYQNTASEGYGGGIGNDRGKVFITNSNVYQNTATYIGGGINNNYYGMVTISGSNVNSNTANNGGGIFNNEGGKVTITNSNVNNNIAQGDGGGIANGPGTVSITNSNVKSNIATSGGGIHNWNGSLSIVGSDFSGNSATKGKVIYNESDSSSTNVIKLNRFTETSNVIYCTKGTIDARYNWWGSNSSPGGKVFGVGMVNVTSWLILKVVAIPILIKNGGTSQISANLLYDSNGGYHNPLTGHIKDGIPVSFSTTLGTITSPVPLASGAALSALKSGTISGIANVSSKLDNQTVKTSIKIDTTPPKVSTTTPPNNKTGVSRTASILIKFTENVIASTYYNSIKIKNLSTNKYVTITKAISGNTLYLRTGTRTANTWYQIIIPARAVRDLAGNKLTATYSFKFRTGA
jgi:hypothetical protein